MPDSTGQVHGKLLAFSADKTTSENSNGTGADLEEEKGLRRAGHRRKQRKERRQRCVAGGRGGGRGLRWRRAELNSDGAGKAAAE